MSDQENPASGAIPSEESTDPEFDAGTRSFAAANRGAKGAKKSKKKDQGKKSKVSLLNKLPGVKNNRKQNRKKKQKRGSTPPSSETSYDSQ